MVEVCGLHLGYKFYVSIERNKMCSKLYILFFIKYTHYFTAILK